MIGSIMVHEMRVEDMLSHGFTFKSGATAKDFSHGVAPDFLYFVMCITKDKKPSWLSKTINNILSLLPTSIEKNK